MKIDFVKINATKIGKKLSFRTCASVLVIQVALFGFQNTSDAGKGKLFQQDMAEKYGEKAARTVVAPGAAASADELYNQLGAASALAQVTDEADLLDKTQIEQVSKFSAKDQLDAASLITVGIAPTPANIATISALVDPQQKRASSFMLAKAIPGEGDLDRVNAVVEMFKRDVEEAYITDHRIGQFVAHALNLQEQEAIIFLAYHDQDPDFGADQNVAAVMVLRAGIGNQVEWENISLNHVNAYVGTVDVHERADIVHLAAIHVDATVDNRAAMAILRGHGANRADINGT
ncbi:MAG: hypothetical protein JSS34_05525, partial [Proteobacteria bacterium]|nr:hypothetical protein [Pseudomonadota bacterium]